MISRVFLPAVVATVLAAVIGGLLMIGGPLQGRQEKFDRLRFNEIGIVARALMCRDRYYGIGETLPSELSGDALATHCSDIAVSADDLSDDETGLPYVYQRLNDEDFSICASFHDAERTARRHDYGLYGPSFDPETGCATGSIR